MRFSFNIAKHIRRALPPFLKKERILAFMEVLHFPISEMHTAFLGYRTEAIYFANLTAQTALLEKYLNDQLDPVERRISIIHTLSGGLFIGLKSLGEDGIFVGLKSEAEDGVFVELKGEVQTALSVDFRIEAVLGMNEDEIKGYVNSYKLAGKEFEIVLN
jgi:hypothetical protein